MFRIPAPLSAAGTATMTAVTATAQTVTHTVTAVSALAESASKHAEAYRDQQVETIALNAASRKSIAGYEARMKSAERLTQLQQKLNADPVMAEIFEALGDSAFDVSTLLARPSSPGLRVAAE